MSDSTAPRPDEPAVALRTLGCKVNRVESEDIAATLIGGGAALVSEDEASVVVVNTCTVTGEADAKARKAVRQALSATGRPLVVVTGCLAAIDAESLQALGDRVVVEPDKERVADRVAELLGGLAASSSGQTQAPRVGEGFRTRVQLKIQDGCDRFCSYCIVPYARGVPRSVPLDRIRAQAEAFLEAGVREVVLTGINVGRYRDGSAGLSDVVRVVARTGMSRIRLSSVEPLDIDERLLSAFAETDAFCPHLHVPLQSGSDAVLKAMGRGYSVGEFVERIEAARERLAGLTFTTDLIAGFPCETDEDHASSMHACETVGFSKLHVFRYSPRRGTPAAQMEAQVPAEVRASRAAELRRLGERLGRSFSATMMGREVEVLIETVREGVASGTTREYLHVELDAADHAIGDLVRLTYGGPSLQGPSAV